MKNKNQIKYFFDKESDILYFSKRKPSTKHISREVGEGIIVRIDSITGNMVGFTILNFLKRGLLYKKSIKLPFRAEFELVK